MNRWLRALEVGAAVTGATAAAAAGLAARRKVTRRSRPTDELGIEPLRADARTVVADDGVRLCVEVDEPDSATGGAGAAEPTLVFVHGYLLSMDSWYFQRVALRGRHRMVFYDQRSHGRSDRSDAAHCTLEQLGRDLAAVLHETAPTGPLVLVGHSMGGMTMMSLAEQLPRLIAERVVGSAFLATSGGNVGSLLPGAPGRLLGGLQPLVVGSLARVPGVFEAGRRSTAHAMTRRLAFGGPVPDSYVDFVDAMISSTPSQVIWDFLPAIRVHRRFVALAAFATAPSVVITGERDAILSARHPARLARELPGARLVQVADAGHMVLLEKAPEVNAVLEELVDSARVRWKQGR